MDIHHANLRALRVEDMTAQEIYDRRAVIGPAIRRAEAEADEYRHYAETRARGYRLREYAEGIADRLAAVTHPR